MLITNATHADIPALSQFAGNVFTHTFGHLYPPEDLAEHLRVACSTDYFETGLAARDGIVMAKDAGVIVGYGKYGEIGVPVTPSSANDKEIHRLYVYHAYHGKQVGALLMQAMLDALADAPSVYLSVYSENPRAQRFYARYGFNKIGTYYYPVGRQRDLEWILIRKNEA